MQKIDEYLQNIVSKLHYSKADQDRNDPGYPDLYISNDLPQGVIAQYTPSGKQGDMPLIRINSKAVESSLRSECPFDLVNALIHERRHFKQDSVGVLDKDELPPPQSSRRLLLSETDAFAYTTAVIDKLASDPNTQWLVRHDTTRAPTMALNAQDVFGQARGQGLEPGQAVARTLLFGTNGDFARQYLATDLAHKIQQVEGIKDSINSGAGKVTIPVGSWMANAKKGLSSENYQACPEYYQQTLFFADQNQGHEWIAKDRFLENALGQNYGQFNEMLENLRHLLEQIKPHLVVRADSSQNRDADSLDKITSAPL